MRGKLIVGNRGSQLVGVIPLLHVGSLNGKAFKGEFLMYKTPGFVLQDHKITESVRLEGISGGHIVHPPSSSKVT